MNVYSQKIEMLMNHYANTAEDMLDSIHWNKMINDLYKMVNEEQKLYYLI